MQIATDPLSLVFLACFLFGLLFLIGSAILGNLGHGGGRIMQLHIILIYTWVGMHRAELRIL